MEAPAPTTTPISTWQSFPSFRCDMPPASCKCKTWQKTGARRQDKKSKRHRYSACPSAGLIGTARTSIPPSTPLPVLGLAHARAGLISQRLRPQFDLELLFRQEFYIFAQRIPHHPNSAEHTFGRSRTPSVSSYSSPWSRALFSFPTIFLFC